MTTPFAEQPGDGTAATALGDVVDEELEHEARTSPTVLRARPSWTVRRMLPRRRRAAS